MALDNLYASNLLLPIHACSASGLPLVSTKNEKKFKLLYLDIGLLHSALGLNMNQLWLQKSELLNKGQLAEQWVGQELLAYASLDSKPELFFWIREKKGSHAEVDYLGVHNGQIFGIEVKASHIGRLKSLHLFMQEKGSPFGVRISTQPLQFNDNILSVPFYAIAKLPVFLEAIAHINNSGKR